MLATVIELAAYLLAALALVLFLAWGARADLLQLALRHAKGLELTTGSISLQAQWGVAPLASLWRKDAPFDRLLVSTTSLAVFTPFGGLAPGDSFARADLVRLRLERESADFGGILEIDGLVIRYVSYDVSFSDTNVSRLVNLLADGSRPLIPNLSLHRIVLRNATVRIEINLAGATPDGAVGLLPPICIEAGEIDLDALSSARSAHAAILGWLNGFVLRALQASNFGSLCSHVHGLGLGLGLSCSDALARAPPLVAGLPLSASVLPAKAQLEQARTQVREAARKHLEGAMRALDVSGSTAGLLASASDAARVAWDGGCDGVGGVLNEVGEAWGVGGVVCGVGDAVGGALDHVEGAAGKAAASLREAANAAREAANAAREVASSSRREVDRAALSLKEAASSSRREVEQTARNAAAAVSRGTAAALMPRETRDQAATSLKGAAAASRDHLGTAAERATLSLREAAASTAAALDARRVASDVDHFALSLGEHVLGGGLGGAGAAVATAASAAGAKAVSMNAAAAAAAAAAATTAAAATAAAAAAAAGDSSGRARALSADAAARVPIEAVHRTLPQLTGSEAGSRGFGTPGGGTAEGNGARAHAFLHGAAGGAGRRLGALASDFEKGLEGLQRRLGRPPDGGPAHDAGQAGSARLLGTAAARPTEGGRARRASDGLGGWLGGGLGVGSGPHALRTLGLKGEDVQLAASGGRAGAPHFDLVAGTPAAAETPSEPAGAAGAAVGAAGAAGAADAADAAGVPASETAATQGRERRRHNGGDGGELGDAVRARSADPATPQVVTRAHSTPGAPASEAGMPGPTAPDAARSELCLAGRTPDAARSDVALAVVEVAPLPLPLAAACSTPPCAPELPARAGGAVPQQPPAARPAHPAGAAAALACGHTMPADLFPALSPASSAAQAPPTAPAPADGSQAARAPSAAAAPYPEQRAPPSPASARPKGKPTSPLLPLADAAAAAVSPAAAIDLLHALAASTNTMAAGAGSRVHEAAAGVKGSADKLAGSADKFALSLGEHLVGSAVGAGAGFGSATQAAFAHGLGGGVERAAGDVSKGLQELGAHLLSGLGRAHQGSSQSQPAFGAAAGHSVQ